MKMLSLIAAAVLGNAALVSAQATPVPAPPAAGNAGVPLQTPPGIKPETTELFEASSGSLPPASKPSANFNLNLKGSKLGDAIDQITDGVGDAQRNENEQPLMPNIIFTGDSRDADMPGNMRLTGVSPVQAVALACAAAGCALEPIYAPAEEAVLPGATAWEKPAKAIGYRVVRDAAKMSGFGSNAVYQLPQLASDISASEAKLQSLRQTLSANHPSVVAAENEHVRLLRMQEQTGPANRPSRISSAGNPLTGPAPTGTGPTDATSGSVKPADADQKIVRVYRLGAAMVERAGESPEEQKRKAILVAETEELIGQTLGTAGLDNTSPNLSFHRGLGVLVAKASMAQHELIEQVVKALRENEAQAAPLPDVLPETIAPPKGNPAK